MKKKNIFVSSILILMVFWAGNAGAFSFQPISRSFSPSGRGAVQSFQLKNDSDDYVALRVKMFSRRVDIDGREIREPAEQLFSVYPQRVVLKPNSIQTLRVKWEGPGELEREQCFRILVEQLPVDFQESDADNSGLKIMFRYLGSIYITPEGTAPELVIESEEVTRSEEGSKLLSFVFHNRGSRHAILSNLHLHVRNVGDSEEEGVRLSPEDLDGINGENILPDSKRRFQIPFPENIEGEEVRIEFEIE